MTRLAVAALCIPVLGALSFAQAQSAEEQARYLEAARATALGYADLLPDFLCSEVIHRSVGDSGQWRFLDTLTVQLTYFSKKESYKVILANGKESDAPYESRLGAISKGEFGSALRWIFEPDSAAEFHWAKTATLRKTPVSIYSYRIARANTQYGLSYGMGADARVIDVGFHGSLYIASGTKMVLRLTTEADDIPADFPIRQASTTIDYDFADVGGRQYLLPAQAETTMLYQPNRSAQKGAIRVLRPTFWRNLVDFRSYRKFAVDSGIQFGEDGAP